MLLCRLYRCLGVYVDDTNSVVLARWAGDSHLVGTDRHPEAFGNFFYVADELEIVLEHLLGVRYIVHIRILPRWFDGEQLLLFSRLFAI